MYVNNEIPQTGRSFFPFPEETTVCAELERALSLLLPWNAFSQLQVG